MMVTSFQVVPGDEKKTVHVTGEMCTGRHAGGMRCRTQSLHPTRQEKFSKQPSRSPELKKNVARSTRRIRITHLVLNRLDCV